MAAIPAAAGPLCGGCIVHQVKPNVAADDANAGAYHPNDDDVAYFDATPRDPHPGSGQLLLFLPGSPLLPSQYHDFLQVAASRGYHAIAISYWNEVELKKLCGGHPACFGAVRHELFDGTNDPAWNIHDRLQAIGSAAAPFSSNDSVRKRLIAFLHWLVHQHGSEHWGQFLVDPKCSLDRCEVRWSKIVLAGHSMGGGEAAFIATLRDVPRVVMLSAPADKDADWTQAARPHPARYFGLAHVCDDLFYAAEMDNWTHFALPGARVYVETGLSPPPPASPKTTCSSLPANQASARPFAHSHRLVMAFDDGCSASSGNVRWHNQVAMDCATQPAVLLDAWNDLLGVP